MTKVDAARAVVKEAVRRHPTGLVHFSSFGKDSMVVMHLAHGLGIETCMTIHNLDEITDSAFVERVCNDWNLRIIPLPLGRATFNIIKEQPFFLSFLSLTRTAVTAAPTNLPKWEDDDVRKLVCVDDELSAQRGTLQEAVTITGMLSGFKRSDMVSAAACRSILNLLPPERVSAYLARHQLTSPHTKIAPDVDLHLPLLDWTDEEVWQYIDEFKVPWSRKVYHSKTHKKRKPKSAWCYRCHDPNQPSIVRCPKLGRDMLNLSSVTQDSDLKLEALRRTHVIADDDAALLHAVITT